MRNWLSSMTKRGLSKTSENTDLSRRTLLERIRQKASLSSSQKTKAGETPNPKTGQGDIPPVPTSFTPNFSLHSDEFRQRFNAHHGHKAHLQAQGDDNESIKNSAVFRNDMVRLGAGLATACVLGLAIFNPLAGPKAVKSIANTNPLGGASKIDLPCKSGGRIGDHVITADFTDFENVLSISPLGGVTAPDEVLPAPYIRINTKNDGSPFQRRLTPVKVPANSDIIAIERHLLDEGGTLRPSWTVRFQPCEGIQIAYERIDELSNTLIQKAGGLASFLEIGGPKHLAREVSIEVDSGSIIGVADGFDILLHDERAEALEMARPERYRKNPYVRADLFDVPATLIRKISPDHSKSRCALDYLSQTDREVWSAKLGDAWGIRRAQGENACRTALIDLKGTTQGAWYTDAAHNGATTKVSAIALAPDTINPERMIFAFHSKLPSLSPDMIATPSAKDVIDSQLPQTSPEQETAKSATQTQSFITFEKGSGRINRAFDEVRDGALYCYENMRVNFVGPKVRGIIVMQRKSSAESPEGDLLTIEARNDLLSCKDIVENDAEKFSFSDNATGFFR